VPEATLVRDSEVYIETQVNLIEPALPWLKQQRMMFLLGVLILIVITFSIALALSLREDVNMEVPEAQDIVVVNSPVPLFSMAFSRSQLPIRSGLWCHSGNMDRHRRFQHFPIDDWHE